MRKQFLVYALLAWIAVVAFLLIRLVDPDISWQDAAGCSVGGTAVGATLLEKWRKKLREGNFTLSDVLTDLENAKDGVSKVKAGELKVSELVREMSEAVAEPPAPPDAVPFVGVEAMRTAARWRAMGMGVAYAAEKAGISPEMLVEWEQTDVEYRKIYDAAKNRIGVADATE